MAFRDVLLPLTVRFWYSWQFRKSLATAYPSTTFPMISQLPVTVAVLCLLSILSFNTLFVSDTTIFVVPFFSMSCVLLL